MPFGKPNVSRLIKNGDSKGIIKLLKVEGIRSDQELIRALAQLEDPATINTLLGYRKAVENLVEETSKALKACGWKDKKQKVAGEKAGNSQVTANENRSLDNDASPENADAKSYMDIPPQLLNLISKKGNLPPIPEIVFKLNEKLHSPDADIREIAKMIATDPVLTAKVISVANSAYYSAGRITIKDLSMAIGRLGLRQISNIVMSFSVIQQFVDNTLLDRSKFWLHSIAVSFCSHALSAILKMSMEEQDQAYIAGMMHDIGIQVFCYIAPDSYSNLLSKLVGDHRNNPKFNLNAVEHSAFRADHADVGAVYVQHWWPVDQQIVQVIADHHKDPHDTSLSTLAKIVIISNQYCNCSGYTSGLNVDVEQKEFDEALYNLLNLDEKQIKLFKKMAESGIESTKHLLSL